MYSIKKTFLKTERICVIQEQLCGFILDEVISTGGESFMWVYHICLYHHGIQMGQVMATKKHLEPKTNHLEAKTQQLKPKTNLLDPKTKQLEANKAEEKINSANI
jgi:hypothetical protein